MSDGSMNNKHKSKAHILVVDDESSIRELLEMLLSSEGYSVSVAASGEEALQKAKEAPFDLVLQDLKMPGMGGIELLRNLRQETPDLPVIIVTAFSTWDDAVEAMRLGAYNYIRKPFDTETIRRIVRGAIEQRSSLQATLSTATGVQESYREIIGNHPLMQDVFAMIQRIAKTDSTVLVQGESGTGKEMVARAIHFRSHRAGNPFVPVNCSAFPESLLESELFGHVRGAFTGAIEDKEGVFRLAEGGTIFLDEVGDMSPATQVKLLRVLEERRISPVGSARQENIDVRIVAATNKDMESEVRNGDFREDLFYRLNVIPLFLPALRDRKDDIPLLVGHFLAKYSTRMNKSITGISDSALQTLNRHHWPGNVRELENIVQRHVALCEGNSIDELVLGSRGSQRKAELTPAAGETKGSDTLIPPAGIDLERELEMLERRYLAEALRMTDGHITKAAQLLGMSYRSIRYRIKKLRVKEHVDSVES